MTMRPNNLLCVLLFCYLSVLSAAPIVAEAQDRPTALYRDKNGYFALRPPEGWRREDFPSESVRSKVAFHHDHDDLRIGILVAPAPALAALAFDEYYERKRQRILATAPQQMPQMRDITVSKSKAADRSVIIVASSNPGALEYEAALFVANGLEYNISFYAPSKTSFDRNVGTYRTVLDSLLVLDPKRQFSARELQTAGAARMKALAEGQEKLGNTEAALRTVYEGLAIDPDNEDLRAMEQRLRSARGSR